MAAGADPDLLVAAAAERYDGDPVEIAGGVSSLVEQLVGEGLLIEDESQPAANAPRLPAGRVPFAVPVLNTYTDMQEFMLVDPLHEVDEVAGWPHAKTG